MTVRSEGTCRIYSAENSGNLTGEFIAAFGAPDQTTLTRRLRTAFATGYSGI
ncbi:MAG: hypothetical protein HXS52_03445 [Theionarchaea archaeon]|nr:hypothetical protein [Theionarchaea archaeon]MBU7036961.1 hypothetical protein [Theionarchaea archaeon]